MRAVRRLGIGILSTYVDEAAFAKREAGVGLDRDLLPVALRVSANPRDEIEARIVRFEIEVNDARDGVGAVLGGRTVAEHFHGSQRDGGDIADIRAVRAEAVQLHQSRAMAAPAVDQHERVMGVEPTQAGGAYERRAVGNRLPRDIERRHDRVDDIHQIGRIDALDLFQTEDVHRHGGVDRRTLLAPRADGHHLFENQAGAARATGAVFRISHDRLCNGGGADPAARGEHSDEHWQPRLRQL